MSWWTRSRTLAVWVAVWSYNTKHSLALKIPLSVGAAARKEVQRSREQKFQNLGDAQMPLLPPEDSTCSVLGQLREIAGGIDLNDSKLRQFEEMQRVSGGVWQTRLLGVFRRVILAPATTTSWLVRQEAKGKVIAGYPFTVGKLIGPRSLLVLEKTSLDDYEAMRTLCAEALSPQAILALQPQIEAILDRRVDSWRDLAREGKEVTLKRETDKFTIEVITTAMFGQWTDEEAVRTTTCLLPQMSAAIVSVPFPFPRPLSRASFLSFGRGMAAKKRLIKLLRRAVRERQEAMAAAEQLRGRPGSELGDGDEPFTCIMDRFLIAQAELGEQGEAGGTPRMVLDDDTLYDNLLTLLWAGYDSTSSTLLRLLELLASEDGTEARDVIKEEIRSASPAMRKGSGSGLLAPFPVLASTVLETSRLRPVSGISHRLALEDLRFGEYTIPAGEHLAWAPLTTLLSEQTYSESKRFCPFRFLHSNAGRRDSPSSLGPGHGVSAASTDINSDGPENVDDGQRHSALRQRGVEPEPPMFGFGKHMCLGRELARLNIVLFLRRFLSEFDYHLVEGQSFKTTMPANAPKDGLKVRLSLKAAEGKTGDGGGR